MTQRLTTTATLATLLTGALLIAAAPASAADEKSMEKCYGIAKAGENGCANAKGTHSCAGHSAVDYDGSDWKLVKSGECDSAGGKKMPFSGINSAPAK